MLSRRKLGLGLGAVGLLAGGLAAIPLASADAQTGSVELAAAAVPVLPPCLPQHPPVVISSFPAAGLEDRWIQLNVLIARTEFYCTYAGLHVVDNVPGARRPSPDARGGTLAIPRGF
jgi:hypothetical protein